MLDASEEPPHRRARRSGGRAGNMRRAGSGAIHQPPWTIPQNRDRPVEPLDAEAIERIHDGAMRILEELGILFLNEEALRILKDAGCDVDMGESRVKMDRAFVMEQVGKAPASFTITPRNPAHQVTVGGDSMLFVNVSSPPNAMDLDRGRRPGDRESFRDFMKLTQYFNCIHLAGGYPVEPIDIHASIRHLDAIHDKLIADRQGRARLFARHASGSRTRWRWSGSPAGSATRNSTAAPRMYTNINSSSPLKHDFPMLDGAMRLARRGQPVIVTPFTLAGAMAPVTIAGAVAQQTAEALCVIALLQCIKPGVPGRLRLVHLERRHEVGRAGLRHAGIHARDADVRADGALLRPAASRLQRLRRERAGRRRRYGRAPSRSGPASPAKANVVYHAAGWLEGGLTASYEKFVMDCETLQQVISTTCEPVAGDTTDDIAVDAIREVGPRGHFFGAEHTQARYETAFYSPFLSDWRNFERWSARRRRWKRRSAPTGSGRRSSPSSSRRRLTRQSPKSLRASSTGASAKAAPRPISDQRVLVEADRA